MSGTITPHADLGSLLNDKAAIPAVLALAAALEDLKVVLVVNGQTFEGVIQFSDTNAIIRIVIDTE
jgi:hypothetical protein